MTGKPRLSSLQNTFYLLLRSQSVECPVADTGTSCFVSIDKRYNEFQALQSSAISLLFYFTLVAFQNDRITYWWGIGGRLLGLVCRGVRKIILGRSDAARIYADGIVKYNVCRQGRDLWSMVDLGAQCERQCVDIGDLACVIRRKVLPWLRNSSISYEITLRLTMQQRDNFYQGYQRLHLRVSIFVSSGRMEWGAITLTEQLEKGKSRGRFCVWASCLLFL